VSRAAEANLSHLSVQMLFIEFIDLVTVLVNTLRLMHAQFLVNYKDKDV